MLLDSVIIPIALTNENQGRTKHFGAAAARKKKYLKQLAALGFNRKPFERRVDIVVTRILGPGQRLMDSSSLLRGNWKEIEDALVQLGWFHDDDTYWIRLTLAMQDVDHRHLGPAIRMDVYEAGAICISSKNYDTSSDCCA